jgi:ubiquitin carboxyl-terminal hydrolase 8
VTTKPPYKEINCDKLPVDKQSEEWASYFKARDNSIITDLFEGQLCSRLECTSCGYKSYTFDSFLDLSVGIPRKSVRITGYVGLEECLNSFIVPERMAECGYKCPKCKGIDKMEKEMTIFRLPKVLVIHLKRFYNSTMRREKLSTTVNLPAQLDMRPYAPRSSK